jgi:hypothetical protein
MKMKMEMCRKICREKWREKITKYKIVEIKGSRNSS